MVSLSEFIGVYIFRLKTVDLFTLGALYFGISLFNTAVDISWYPRAFVFQSFNLCISIGKTDGNAWRNRSYPLFSVSLDSRKTRCAQ
jgi:hypothetical protein